MNIAITGGAGYLGQLLAARLCEEPGVANVFILDTVKAIANLSDSCAKGELSLSLSHSVVCVDRGVAVPARWLPVPRPKRLFLRSLVRFKS